MAIWVSTGLNIWLDPNLKSFIASKQKSVALTEAPVSTIPTKAMQSYNVVPKKPSSSYAWLEKDEWDYIDKQLESSWLSGNEKKLAQESIYKLAIQTKQSKAFLRDRESMRQKLVSWEINVWDKETANKIYKSSQFADMIREVALLSWKDVTKVDDDAIIQSVLADKPDFQQPYNDFMSGKIDAIDLDYKMKWEERPKNIWDTIKDIWEWVVSFAGWIPKVIAETWILDKQVQKLNEWVVWESVRNLAEKLFWKETVSEYQKQEWWKSFSEFAAWKQVGWDQESKTAVAIEYALDALEFATWLAWLKTWLKFWAKQALKKSIKESIETWWEIAIKSSKLDSAWKQALNIIKESDISKELKWALPRAWLNEWRSWFMRWIFWTGKKVKPSQKSIDSAATISTEILKPSTKPWKLYTQVADKVWEIASELWTQLKNIKTTKAPVATTEKLTELATEIGDYSPSMMKATRNLIDKLASSKNLDEVWEARKLFDDVVWKNVKLAKEWKSKILKTLRWESRWMVNDYIDDIANNIADVWVKWKFKVMTNLYHALWQIENNISTIAKPTIWALKKTWMAFKEAIKYGVGWAVAWAVINKATWK